jgi:hypothetical protein
MWLRDGELVPVNNVVLRELVSKYVFVKSLVVHNGKYEVACVPVTLDDQMIRAILTGHDPHPRTGGDIKGGPLAGRLPKVSAASIGLAA